LWICLPLLALLAAGSVSAQEEASEATETSPPAVQPLDRTTPRGAVHGYLLATREGDYERAASYLNLAPVPSARRAEQGPVLARHLKLVLDQELWIDLEAISDDPLGDPDDGLPARRERVGVIETARGPVEITLNRVTREGASVWEFSSALVSRIPDLYDEFGYGRFGEELPDFLFRQELFRVQLWQWIGLLVIAAGAGLVSWLVAWLVLRALHPVVSRSESELDDQLIAAVAGPLRLGVAIALFSGSLLALRLAPPARAFFAAVTTTLAVIAATWLLTRLVDIVGSVLEQRLSARGEGANAFVPMGRKAVKVVIIALAVLAALDSFGFNVTALIAGLGVGGLAVALAAQKTLENLFGGATLVADRPVKVGDFCRFGDKVGVIEEIGLRSTRVRTLERTLVTVPNSEFAALQLENFAVRDKILFRPRLGLRYETRPDQVRYVLSRIKEILDEHPRVDPDPARVRFVGFGDSSLDLDIYAYLTATDFGEYLQIAEDLNLRLMDAIEEAGTGFAFPSTTAYVTQDDGLDAERASRAVELGAALRSEGA
jgi:MscS family membrane protein